MTQRIYLDNAATSWPKRQSVLDAAWRFARDCGATAGRGSYGSSIQAQRHLEDARLRLAQLIGSRDPGTIAFCNSGTHALNAALAGVLRPGDHVIATQMEHNSVLRPLRHLTLARGIKVDYAPCDFVGLSSISAAENLVTRQTRWIVVGHASNVTGAVHDLAAWSQLASDAKARLIVDASQTLGYHPLDVEATGISLLAAAGHKGLGGLAGSGLLYASAELHADFQPLLTGGTGVQSESIEAETSWPHVVEVGNHNLPGIVSMGQAARELVSESLCEPVAWQTHWRKIMDRLISGLRSIASVTLVGYPPNQNAVPSVDRVPLVSLLVDQWDVHDLAAILDTQFGIEARSGFHCAALVHKPIGSHSSGGTLRLSPGHSTTPQQIDTTIDALRQIVSVSTSQ
jgi:cysteine desulfurase/selenocysteine lyase